MSIYQMSLTLREEFAAVRARNEAELLRQQEEERRLRAEAEEWAKRNAEERRVRLAKALDDGLRTAFFAANPSADEAAFQRLLPALRDEHMKRQTLEQPVGVYDQISAEAAARAAERQQREKMVEERLRRA